MRENEWIETFSNEFPLSPSDHSSLPIFSVCVRLCVRVTIALRFLSRLTRAIVYNSMVSCTATLAVNSLSPPSPLRCFRVPSLCDALRSVRFVVPSKPPQPFGLCLAVHFETFKTDAGKRTKFRVYLDGRRWRVTLLIASRIYGTRGRERTSCRTTSRCILSRARAHLSRRISFPSKEKDEPQSEIRNVLIRKCSGVVIAHSSAAT